jgi:hypothetical protein
MSHYALEICPSFSCHKNYNITRFGNWILLPTADQKISGSGLKLD